MTRKAFLKQYGARFAAAFALLCLLFYTVYHVFSGSTDSLMTTPVRQVTDRRLVSGKGYVFREEEVLSASEAGIVRGLVPNGSKVSASMPVAEIWNTGNAATLEDDQITLERVSRLIGILEESLSSGATLSKAQLYQKAANDSFLAIQKAMQEGNWQNLGALESKMLTFLDQYTVATQGAVEIQATLDRLKTVRASFFTGSCQTLSASDRSGYFYHHSFVDGYESLFTKTALEELSAESFARLSAAEATQAAGQVAGKIVYGHVWWLAVELDADEKAVFIENRGYTFTFPDNAGSTLRLVCTRLIEGADGGAIGVFEASEIPPGFAFFRAQRVEITASECEGYYVPESAIQQKDGIGGVYVLKDGIVRFRRIEILYQGDGYCIVSENRDANEEFLSLYDLLITSGKNLYEGRVYQ